MAGRNGAATLTKPPENDVEAVELIEEPVDEPTYVVLTDALTVSVKGRRPGTKTGMRCRKGEIITLNDRYNDIDRLIALRAIALNDGEAKRRTTPAVLARAAGGLEDEGVRAANNLFDVTHDDVTPTSSVTLDRAAIAATLGNGEDGDYDEPEYTATPAEG